jgi:BirA family biotin operon repressor/biotin-[acetyl-CoA-carboxylase] ligase
MTEEWRITWKASTGSTNADAIEAAGKGEPEGFVVVAEQQTEGRGRLDRHWVSPPGKGLTFSVVLRPTVPMDRWGWLPLMAGVALAQTLGDDARLKWPNDLLLGRDGLKAGGVLSQTAEDACVLGIGVNVLTEKDELPVPEATSMVLCGFHDPRPESVLRWFLPRLGMLYQSWLDHDGDAHASGLAEFYRQYCKTIGQEVKVSMPSGDVTGIALEIDHDGHLVVQDHNGQRVVVTAGDVTHVRPT